MTSNGKQFTVTRKMLTRLLLHVIAGISAQFSNFAFVLFCYITNHLMNGPEGNSEFCSPRISMFPETKSRETLRFSGNKIHCSPRNHSLSVRYRDLNFKKAGKRLQIFDSVLFSQSQGIAVFVDSLPNNSSLEFSCNLPASG